MITSICVTAVFIVAAASRTSAQNVVNYGPCQTPVSEAASCISLMQCTYLLNMVSKTPLLDDEINFLRQSQCGTRNGQVLVCCSERYIGRQLVARTTELRSNLPEPGTCAGIIISDRIVGGNITQISEYPWMVRIEYHKFNLSNTTGYHCGGSLINDRYVLTAAHCIAAIPKSWTPIRVRLGEWNTKTNPDCVKDVSGNELCAEPHIDVSIERAIVHPNYSMGSLNQFFDIALLRLSHSVSYTDYVRPICLPAKDNVLHTPFQGTFMDISGWGYTEELRSSDVKLKASVPVLPLEECQRIYSTINKTLRGSQICAGGVEGIDSCSGDSGGALIGLDTSNKFKVYHFIAGVVSYGPSPCGFKGWPGVYTKVSDFIDWIQQNIRS